MDHEHTERNRNESDNGWVRFVLRQPRETMEDILYMVASIPIIDLSFIRNYSSQVGPSCPCLCPFHT